MDPNFPQALQFVRQVQTTIAGDGRQTYDQFQKTLNQYRLGIIDSSTVISTVQTLFHNHQTLIDAFKPFLPRHRPAAPPPEEHSKLRICLDFINRVGTRFDGGRAYRNFLDCMRAYSRAEITASDVRVKVVGLFGNNEDLLDEFLRFFPEPHDGERSKKRRRIDRKMEGEFELRQPERINRRVSGSGSRDDEESAAAPRRTERRRLGKLDREEEAAARRVMDMDNEMEDSLCEIDVGIGNLESSIQKAMSIYDGLSCRLLSPADIRLDEHFTPLNLACIRSHSGSKLLEEIAKGEFVKHTLDELVEALMKKKEGLERERVKIVQRWNRFRHKLNRTITINDFSL